MEIVSWVQAHWVDIVKGVAYVIAIASIIVKITPSPKDDIALGKLKKILSKFIALNP